MRSKLRYSAALVAAALAVCLALPVTAQDEAGKKDMVTQWKCSGPVDCGADVEPCVYKDEVVGDKGGDVRRAVLRLIFACAERRGVDQFGPSPCRNGGIKCREIK
jgi:hypothetical protein